MVKKILLCSLIFITVFLRLKNISPYYIYPDTYQNILIAENIHNYNNVVGTLGNDGQVWPQYVGWTRPGFPLLILIVNILINNYFTSAQIITLIATILATPLSYFFLKYWFKRDTPALAGALLVTFSANYTMWSGFILTEGIGVCIQLALLTLFIKNLTKPSQLADIYDLLTGFLLAATILTRYEYALLSLPLTMLILLKSPTKKIKLTNIAIATWTTLALTAAAIFPIIQTLQRISTQSSYLLTASIITILIAILTILALNKQSEENRKKLLNLSSKIIIILTAILTVFIILQALIPNFPLQANLSAIRAFFQVDTLLAITFLTGIYMLNKNKKHEEILFIALAIIPLAFFYYRVNQTMQRYWTHLIPYLLIPASYGLEQIIIKIQNKKNIPAATILILLITYQAYAAYNGLKEWGRGEYFTTSYSQEAAKKIQKYITNKEQLLLVSFPESYFAHTHQSTHSLTDNPPYTYIPERLNSKEILIIEDMGMREIFPNFTNQIQQKLQQYKIEEEWTHRAYHFASNSTQETKPINIYKIELKKLQEILKKSP